MNFSNISSLWTIERGSEEPPWYPDYTGFRHHTGFVKAISKKQKRINKAQKQARKKNRKK